MVASRDRRWDWIPWAWPVFVALAGVFVSIGAAREAGASTRRDLDAVAAEVRELRAVVVTVASIGAQLDGIDRRLARIEDRLDRGVDRDR